ncbi:MAG: AAA family ATPase [Candidatus Beckwithbacteria bacterium]|nr:AAA family ATPase [Patescibacteria group bacterium]
MANKKIVIAIVGMAGSGKSISCAHFKSLGYPILRFGDQTDIGLKELGLSLIEANEKKYREDLRKNYGMKAYAVKIEPRIIKAFKKSDIVFLDGLYSWEEYTYLKSKFSNFFLICIYARPAVRYQRLVKRLIRPLTKKDAYQRDIAELVNLHKGGPIAMADFLIKNNKQTKKLFDKLTDTLTLIKNHAPGA